MRIACPACEVTQEVAGLIMVEGGFGFECQACGARPMLAPQAAPAPALAPASAPASAALAPVAEPAPSQADNPLISLSDPEPAEPSDVLDGPVAALAPPTRLRPPAGQVACPKCDNWQVDPGFCHRCGLDLARALRGELPAVAHPLAGHRLGQQAQQAWDRIAHRLEDEAAHRAFIALCAEHGLLEFAGQCYRRAESNVRQPTAGEAVEGHPADQAQRAQAEQRLAEYRKRVIQAALARIGTGELRGPGIDPMKVRRWLLLVALALLFLGFAVGVYVFSRYQTMWLQNG